MHHHATVRFVSRKTIRLLLASSRSVEFTTEFHGEFGAPYSRTEPVPSARQYFCETWRVRSGTLPCLCLCYHAGSKAAGTLRRECEHDGADGLRRQTVADVEELINYYQPLGRGCAPFGLAARCDKP